MKNLIIKFDHYGLEAEFIQTIRLKQLEISVYNWGHSGIISLNKEQFDQLYQFLTDNKDFFND